MNWNAYHFVGDTLRDGRPVPANGVTLVHNGPLEMCKTGLHASRKSWQALVYAPGNNLCRVNCAGEIIEGGDKLDCAERTIISRIDAGPLLQSFARQCALDVIKLWDAPDIVRDYLTTGNEKLRDAARAAAWAAARDAARATARAAARDAAWAAEAARAVQRRRFTRMVNAEFARVK